MYSVILNTLLVMTASGSVLALLLMLFKRLNKRIFGAGWQYYAYIAVLIIMLVPISITLPYTDMSSPAEPVGAPAPEDEYAEQIQSTEPSTAEFERRIRLSDKRGISEVLFCIWLVGAAVFIGLGLISYIKFLVLVRRNSYQIECRELDTVKKRCGIDRRITVRRTGLLYAPMLVGAIKPVLLLPERAIGGAELEYILMHELTHYKRGDIIYKWAAMLANGTHWFNPIAYVISAQINEECEISCDLKVVKNMGEEEKREYMKTILQLTEREE